MKITHKRITAAGEVVPVRLRPEDMNDPKSVDLDSIRRSNLDAERQRIAEEERQAQLALLREKYSEMYNIIDEYRTDPSECITQLFELLVPASGKAEIVAGELVRAANKLGYRWFNDGDRCYSGYGIETCGNAINYLCSYIPELESKVTSTAESDMTHGMDDDTEYDSFLLDMYEAVVEFISSNPDIVSQPSEDMFSEQYSDDSWLKEIEPKQTFDFSWSDLGTDLQNYLEEFEDQVDYSFDDAYEDFLDDFEMDNPDAYINRWARDAAEIEISYGDMDENEYYRYIEVWSQSKLDELESEYGTFDELERARDGEEDEEFDEEEEDEE